jgi:hypothetical protein
VLLGFQVVVINMFISGIKLANFAAVNGHLFIVYITFIFVFNKNQELLYNNQYFGFLLYFTLGIL